MRFKYDATHMFYDVNLVKSLFSQKYLLNKNQLYRLLLFTTFSSETICSSIKICLHIFRSYTN